MRIDESFDLVLRELRIAGAPAAILFVDGMVKDEAMAKMLQSFFGMTGEQRQGLPTAADFAAAALAYTEAETAGETEKVITAVLSGQLALLLEGYREALLIDLRTYPVRGVEEPDTDRILRGSHEGFVETLVFNTALIRRHIRDTRLTMEYRQIGCVSKTDVVMCYLEGIAEEKYLTRLREKLNAVRIPSLALGQESLAECLCRRAQRYNPFPRVRYTERPDSAAAALAEGRILLIVDNSPAVMILPTALFDFVQDTNDYYFPPLVGTHLRGVRMLVFGFTSFLTPVWYLLITHPALIPPWLEFVRITHPIQVPVLVQLLVVEVVVDAIKLASLNTPGALSNAFGVVGTLVLGEFAVEAGLFVPEVLLYMAVVTVGTFTQPSYELGFAFKLFRLLFLLLTALLGGWGFALGVGVMLAILATTPTVLGNGYLYPLIPFDRVALKRLLFRRLIYPTNSLRKR